MGKGQRSTDGGRNKKAPRKCYKKKKTSDNSSMSKKSGMEKRLGIAEKKKIRCGW